jgi:hypothetical protein
MKAASLRMRLCAWPKSGRSEGTRNQLETGCIPELIFRRSVTVKRVIQKMGIFREGKLELQGENESNLWPDRSLKLRKTEVSICLITQTPLSRMSELLKKKSANGNYLRIHVPYSPKSRAWAS